MVTRNLLTAAERQPKQTTKTIGMKQNHLPFFPPVAPPVRSTAAQRYQGLMDV